MGSAPAISPNRHADRETARQASHAINQTLTESAPGLGTYMHLPAGKYQVTETVAPAYLRLLHIASGYAAATVEVTVVKGSLGSQRTVARPAQTARSLSAAPDVPYLANPPKSALPDLVPHPA